MDDRCVGSKYVRRKYFRHFDSDCYIFRLAEDELTVTMLNQYSNLNYLTAELLCIERLSAVVMDKSDITRFGRKY